MQNTSEAQQGQSFIDICIQETGSISGIVKMAVLNDRSLSSAIEIGDVFLRPEVADSNAVRFFTPASNRPATGFTYSPVTLPQPKEGISFWAIKDDFVITPQFTSAP